MGGTYYTAWLCLSANLSSLVSWFAAVVHGIDVWPKWKASIQWIINPLSRTCGRRADKSMGGFYVWAWHSAEPRHVLYTVERMLITRILSLFIYGISCEYFIALYYKTVHFDICSATPVLTSYVLWISLCTFFPSVSFRFIVNLHTANCIYFMNSENEFHSILLS